MSEVERVEGVEGAEGNERAEGVAGMKGLKVIAQQRDCGYILQHLRKCIGQS